MLLIGNSFSVIYEVFFRFFLEYIARCYIFKVWVKIIPDINSFVRERMFNIVCSLIRLMKFHRISCIMSMNFTI